MDEKPPRPRRRWKKILLITGGSFFALMLLALLLGPAIIGSVAKSQIVSAIMEETQADVTVGAVSFSWSGRVELSDLRVVPKGFTVPLAQVKQVLLDVSLGSAMGGEYIATVEVVGPQIVVEKGPDGKFNYEFPPRPPKSKKPGSEKESPEKTIVKATLRVRDGGVRIREGGLETVFHNVALEAKVDTLEKPIAYALSLENPTHGKLSIAGALDIDKMSGPVKATLEKISLKNLTAAARAYGQAMELDGTVDGSIEADLRGPLSTFDFTAKEMRANAKMGPMLELISPIFHTYNGTVDGRVSAGFKLAWKGPIDPGEKDWTAAASKSLSGSGSFSVAQLSVTGSPAVGEIMTALGEPNLLEGEILATDVRIGGGRCEYQNMVLRLRNYDLRFSGFVGFDRKMDLMVEMPITDNLRKKHPRLEKYIGKTFFVPLKGTVDKPRFDFARAIEELAKRALEGVIQDKAKELLEDLFKKKK